MKKPFRASIILLTILDTVRIIRYCSLYSRSFMVSRGGVRLLNKSLFSVKSALARPKYLLADLPGLEPPLEMSHVRLLQMLQLGEKSSQVSSSRSMPFTAVRKEYHWAVEWSVQFRGRLKSKIPPQFVLRCPIREGHLLCSFGLCSGQLRVQKQALVQKTNKNLTNNCRKTYVISSCWKFCRF